MSPCVPHGSAQCESSPCGSSLCGTLTRNRDPVQFPVRLLHPETRVPIGPEPDPIQVLKKLGHGNFGSVYLVQIRGNKYAVKRAAKRDKIAEEMLEKEASFLTSIPVHPCIVAIRCVFYHRKRFGIVLDFAPGKQLYTLIRKKELSTSSPLVPVIAYQVFRGLGFLHARAIIHRDIKPSNLIVDMETGVTKIIDFGISTKRKPKMGIYAGTVPFQAPELLYHSTSHGPPVDIWSAAVVLSEMVLGDPVFGRRHDFCSSKLGRRQMRSRISCLLGFPRKHDLKSMQVAKAELEPALTCQALDERLKAVHVFGDKEALHNLLNRIFVYNPEERPTAWEVLEDSYFNVVRQGQAALRVPVPRDLLQWTYLERQYREGTAV